MLVFFVCVCAALTSARRSRKHDPMEINNGAPLIPLHRVCSRSVDAPFSHYRGETGVNQIVGVCNETTATANNVRSVCRRLFVGGD